MKLTFKSSLVEEFMPSTEVFAFGDNWLKFVRKVDASLIGEAKASLVKFMRGNKIRGKTFVDVGCGSGLFSIAAVLLGARKVVSFDVDGDSVKCTEHLREKFGFGERKLEVRKGSALNRSFLKSLGKFDIVYSWGVLHHTGKMWEAIDNTITLLKKDGLFYLAIYNKRTGFQSSEFWKVVKKTYLGGGSFTRFLIECLYFVQFCLVWATRGKNPLSVIKNWKSRRGMDWHTDLVDWLGGYPYEFAKNEEIKTFVLKRGFRLVNSIDVKNGTGCNEFLFKKN